MGAQTFHQQLDIDRLRCTLTPHRNAVWRIRRTKVGLSAFAACTLANANILDFNDLKLFRAREYETDEGPWDPISGGFVAACGAFSGMAMGLADIPMETYKAAKLPFENGRKQSLASASTVSQRHESSLGEQTTLSSSTTLSPRDSQTSLTVPDSFNDSRNYGETDRSSLSSTRTSSSMRNAITAGHASRRSHRSRNEPSGVRNHDMMRQGVPHTSKGLGGFTKALVQSPVDISTSLTKGMHNFPKYWDDQTVRSQPKVSGFASGVKTAGKEFGLGWYDGLSGLVTQPYNGARKDGASGFAKGVGKGFGGFFTKATAGSLGILSYPLEGVRKEVQKLFGGNVENYIISSRTAQGYEEWRQSSDAEREDVIARWRLIQKYLKKKRGNDEMMRDLLDAQRKSSVQDAGHRQTSGLGHSSNLSINGAQTTTGYLNSRLSAAGGSQISLASADVSPQRTPGAEHVCEATIPQAQETSRGDGRACGKHSGRADGTYDSPSPDTKGRESYRTGHEHAAPRDEGAAQSEEPRQGMPRTASRTTGVADELSHVQPSHSYDQGHLAGTRRDQCEAQQRSQRGEKTTEEKTEEDIVVTYMKKQSLLESQHLKKSNSHALGTENEEDDEMQKALQLSMQQHESEARSRQWGAADE